MHKGYKYLFLLFILTCSFVGVEQSSKKELIIKALNDLNDENSLVKIIPILKKDAFFRSVIPIGNPLKEKYRISSSFGYRIHPTEKTKKFHTGIDLAAQYATLIYATADGEVIFSGKKGANGKCVIIQHKYNFQSAYSHLTLLYTKKGKFVKKGTVIGFVGSTGRSTGNHLHYEIKWKGNRIDPKNWIE